MRNLWNQAVYFGVAMIVLGLLASGAGATVLVTHTGSADPTTEGWTASTGGGVSTSGPGNEDGKAYWFVQSPEASRLGYTVDLTSGNVTDPSGWTATAVVRLVLGGEPSSQAALQVIDKKDRFDIYLSDGSGTVALGVWIRSVAGDVQVSSADPRVGYHTYQITFDPAGNAGDGAASYYMDGALLATQTRADAVNNTSYRRILWGDNNSGAGTPSSESHWAFAQFETGQRVVPEPATILLLGVGGLLFHRRRRRRSPLLQRQTK
ncbi:MAG: PEP-CTERM sorting domain-containing protein [Phycisphaerae bacterium]|nr:PEP-CTERM sorting domain-containing protein [Phycisphaerae bacterium]